MPAPKKCVVWDLDRTVWDDIALEGNVEVRDGVRRTIETLDRRGILHSVASRNDEDLALKILRENRLDAYFLSPKINWLPKSANIVAIGKELGIALDSLAFVDDEPFEREQVSFMLPQVMVVDAALAPGLADMPEFSPAELTEEAGSRRLFYRAERERGLAEQRFGTREEFLKSCGMSLKVRVMTEADIPRVKELATRTHQLNTTGRLFDADELREICRGGGSRTVEVAELSDKFGPYGIIGVALIDSGNDSWRLEYLAMSCRILGRGIERAFLVELLARTRGRGVRNVEVLYKATGRNRMMLALYQMMGFRPSGPAPDGEAQVFSAPVDGSWNAPGWVRVL